MNKSALTLAQAMTAFWLESEVDSLIDNFFSESAGKE